MAEETENVVSLDGRRVKATAKNASALTQKWGRETMAAKYTVIPCALLRGQARLHIGPIELAVLIHLIDHWWREDVMPWPAKRTIADRLQISTKTVQRAIVNLEREGLVRRRDRYLKTGGRASNQYDLSPLVERLKPIAEEMVKASKDAREKSKAAERPGLKKRAPSSS